jgi:hypothetical protein
MSSIPPADGGDWRPGSPSGDHLPAVAAGSAGRGQRTLVVAVVSGLAVVAVVVAVLVARGSGGDEPGGGVGEALASATTGAPGDSPTTAPATFVPRETTTTTEQPSEAPAGRDLPAIEIPAKSSPPTTIPGSEPGSLPGGDGPDPLFGHLVVDLEPGGYLDFPVYLRQEQSFQLLSLGDDGIMTEIEVYGPGGTRLGWWAGGEPGIINGLEWHPDDPLPATGTYVIRAIHTGGSDGPFAIGFYGDA